MTALTANRVATASRTGQRLYRPVAAGVHIFAGSLVVMSGGYASPGHAATGLIADGRAEFEADNTGGANGAISVEVYPGIYHWANSGAGPDLIAAANIGATCYVVDDQTVALTNDTNTLSAAGKIVDVDATGVWVATGIAFPE